MNSIQAPNVPIAVYSYTRQAKNELWFRSLLTAVCVETQELTFDVSAARNVSGNKATATTKTNLSSDLISAISNLSLPIINFKNEKSWIEGVCVNLFKNLRQVNLTPPNVFLYEIDNEISKIRARPDVEIWIPSCDTIITQQGKLLFQQPSPRNFAYQRKQYGKFRCCIWITITDTYSPKIQSTLKPYSLDPILLGKIESVAKTHSELFCTLMDLGKAINQKASPIKLEI